MQRFPFDEGKTELDMLLNPAEFGVLRMSPHANVRAKHFDVYANACKANADRVIEMLALRRNLALSA